MYLYTCNLKEKNCLILMKKRQ